MNYDAQDLPHVNNIWRPCVIKNCIIIYTAADEFTTVNSYIPVLYLLEFFGIIQRACPMAFSITHTISIILFKAFVQIGKPNKNVILSWPISSGHENRSAAHWPAPCLAPSLLSTACPNRLCWTQNENGFMASKKLPNPSNDGIAWSLMKISSLSPSGGRWWAISIVMPGKVAVAVVVPTSLGSVQADATSQINYFDGRWSGEWARLN